MDTVTVSITLPATFTATGAMVAVDVNKLAANGDAFMGQLFMQGIRNVLGDTYSTNGKDAATKDEALADKRAAVEKKVAAWEKGEINITQRGSAETTRLRKGYRAMLEAARGTHTDKAWADFQFASVTSAIDKGLITAAKPEKGKVVDFDLFMTARAASVLHDTGADPAADDFAALVADKVAETMEQVRAKADEIEAEEKAAKVKVDTSGLNF